jgi:hypothetical protein
MQTNKDIWVQVQRGGGPSLDQFGDLLPSPPSGTYHALFTALVRLKSFKEISPYQWGWNKGALMQEALDRQRLFIEAQHAYDELAINIDTNQRTLALRCIRYPKSDDLLLVLIGKIAEITQQKAKTNALELWQEISSIFPYEYDLLPAKTFDEFVYLTGFDIIKTTKDSEGWREIRRFDGMYNLIDQQIYMLGMWQQSQRANEQIWRALGGWKQPMIYNVLLRPTMLFDEERLSLLKIIDSLNIVANKEEYKSNPEIQWMLQNYRQLVTQLHFPFCVQVILVSPSTIPNYLIRAIGSGFCHSEEKGITGPGYQKVCPNNKNLPTLVNELLWLEPDFSYGGTVGSYTRLPYLFDSWGANTAFRFPFLAEAGLPGVMFSDSYTK